MKIFLVCAIIILLFKISAFAENEVVKNEVIIDTKKQEDVDDGTARHFKNGMTSCLLSLLYSPIKVNIAMIGGVIGGLAYPLSGFNADVSKKIWTTSMGGTYLITEDILTGKEEHELFFKKNKEKGR